MSRSGCVVLAVAVFASSPGGLARAQTTEPPLEGTTPPPPPPASGAPGGLKIEGNNASVKLGFLAQPAYEYLSRTAATPESYQTLFLRRARLLVLMTLGSQLELFAETDSPNLGRGNGPTPAAGLPGGGVAGSAGMFLQDVFATWKPLEELKLEAGEMLIPLSHNGLQSAASLYGWDYFAFTFQQNGALQNFVGRDTGVQARGLVAQHLEYRLGVFTGRRAPVPMMGERPSQSALRVAARVQYNVFDAESAFFYGGTYGGSKRILSVGAGLDLQKSYKAFAGDAFVDWPLGGDVVTGQVDVIHYDGGTWAPLASQTDVMAEAGYRFGAVKLSPILRFEAAKMSTSTAASPDITRFGVGLVWWYMGHNANLKLFYTLVKPTASGVTTLSSYSQLNLQAQFFVF
jgi:hypothetical protein